MRFLISSALRDDHVSMCFQTLGNELKARGHEVTFVTWGKRSSPKSYEHDSSVLWYPNYRPQGWKDIHFIWDTARQKKIDCAIGTHVAINAVAAGAFLAAVPVRIGWAHTQTRAFLIEFGGLRPRAVFFLVRRRLVYSLLTHIAAVSRSCADDLRRQWRVASDKITVIPNAIRDVGEFEVPRDRSRGRLVCVGRLRKVKGQDILIRALKIVQEQCDAQVRLLGDGEERGALEQLARELGVRSKVSFCGWASGEEVLREMAEASLTVVPSRDESFCFVNVESMSVGTPIVASMVCGIPEIVRDGVAGILVPPEDPESLAKAIVKLLTDDELRKQMGRNARQGFIDEFELSRRIPKVADWLEGLVKAAGRK